MMSKGNYVIGVRELIQGDSVYDDKITKIKKGSLLVVEENGVGCG